MAFKKTALVSMVALAASAAAAPCDIYASGGTPCVAAHSTTRALYSSYNGRLYSVIRDSDSRTSDINTLKAGGAANAASQDSFCSGTTCRINTIYDQSGRANHLTVAPAGGAASGPDDLAVADAAPITVLGQKAYGVYISPGTGYRNDNTNGIATGNQAEGIYAVLDSQTFNSGCCFDYGNAETNNLDDGAGTMEAIYFGSNTFWGSGAGSGPWVMADLEDGLFSGYGPKVNTNDPSISSRFVTAIVKGDVSNLWAIRSGDSQNGGLSTHYSGQRPSGYYPMKKQGAIILGIGGDNSKSGQGTFYEGVMTSGYPSDATENSVQQDVVAAKYRAS
ncbi:related to Alpha arabinofuranosidase [Melanopsichium pennsylvanicum]|uniref:Alpha-L-arabinofuranosidase n=2 Tax=Melanopsichium pennsylvanicum TaxID=63383 RepID=A0AAJ5C486_9BASI|nr:related to Alpha arabinofuranosidase [Melanopsichium pennsylvanicum 4]SNX83431.1 related to Alpha arabinofuranosidase [Melanopsichium pennsylvanicum]